MNNKPQFVHNPYTRKSVELVRSGKSLFITGKAGTGKTYLLEHIVEVCKQDGKNVSVVAPTGVAARNAGGKTIHSFLKMKPLVYIPGAKIRGYKYALDNRDDELDTIRKLDILIIDEVSMVRCDLMDCIDDQLRHYRRNDLPFGGLQVLLFGDFYQLPPVLDEDKTEEEMIKEHYLSEFAFHSDVWRKVNFPLLELEVNQRQKGDDAFFEILNRIRVHRETSFDLNKVNRKVEKGRMMSNKDNVVKLCAFNRTADGTNFALMQELTSDPVEKKAKIRYYRFGVPTFVEEDECDDFKIPKDDYPTEKYLKLKVGAKVMFLRNEPNLYDNGTVGVVKRIYEDEIVVLTEEGKTVNVERASWPFYHDVWDKKNTVYEQYLYATFEQFPLRLAWAITIHKSQGLTFNDVIIDIRNAFAHGQTYVALSRCKTLEGVRLNSAIKSSEIIIDQNVINFMNNAGRITIDVTNGAKSDGKMTADIFRQTKMYDVMGYKTRDWMIDKINYGLSYDEALEKLHTDKPAAWNNTMTLFKRRYPYASKYETKDGKQINIPYNDNCQKGVVETVKKTPEPKPAQYKCDSTGTIILKADKDIGGFVGVVLIPNTIKEIGNNAFEHCERIRTIFIPSSVVRIGQCAFNGCSKLKTLTLSEGLIEIGNQAFFQTPIAQLSLPNSLEKIGNDAFAYTKLDNVSLPKNVSKVGANAFTCPIQVSSENAYLEAEEGVLYTKHKEAIVLYPQNLTSKSFQIPEQVKTINWCSFFQAKVENIKAPTKLQEIESYAFMNCSSLTQFTIPRDVKYLNSCIFQGCKSLRKIQLLSSNVELADDAFSNIEATSIEITVPYSYYNQATTSTAFERFNKIWIDADSVPFGISLEMIKKVLFPVNGIIIGDTESCVLSSRGIKFYKNDDRKFEAKMNTISYVCEDQPSKISQIKLTKVSTLPSHWISKGFNFDMSYNEWKNFLITKGFKVIIKEQPKVCNALGKSSLNAFVIGRTQDNKAQISLIFKYGIVITSPASTDTKGSIYSLSIEIL